MVLIKKYRDVPVVVCEKCGSNQVKHLKTDFFVCSACSHVFETRAGLSFSKEKLLTRYDMIVDYENFIRTKLLKSWLNLNCNDIFLDAGCAWGDFACYAATIVREAVGIDIVPSRLIQAEKSRAEMNLKNLVFKEANIYKIPYPDNYFDKVLCAEVLEHTLQPKKAIAELSRVCGGILVLQVPTSNLFRTIGEKIFHLGSTEPRQITEKQSESLPHVQNFTGRQISNITESCGLEITNMAGVKIISLNSISDNRFLIGFEYFCDSILGTRSPFNDFGLMTLICCKKSKVHAPYSQVDAFL